MPATPTHHTATVDSAWDGPAQEKKLDTPIGTATGNKEYAWRDPDGDPDTKTAWKFPHHMVDGDGKPGAANVKACTSGIGVLNGGMGGSNIPSGDRQAVYSHLKAHLSDAKVDDIPELKAAPGGRRMEMRTFREQMRGIREFRQRPFGEFELREVPNGTGGTDLLFTGYACVTGTDYEMEDWVGPWIESVANGAFKKTLAQNADVAFLLNHEGMSLARTKPGTLQLAEDFEGLHTEARLDSGNFQVQALRSAIDRGDIDEMSFAFRVVRQEWQYVPEAEDVPDESYDRRTIFECNIHQGDVSAVNFGANSHTAGTVSLRSRTALNALRGLGIDGMASALRELREGKTLSSDTVDTLTTVLGLVSDADDGVDQAQIYLASLMGVPNPDDDAQWDDLPNKPAGGEDDPPTGTNQSQNSGALKLARAKARRASLISS